MNTLTEEQIKERERYFEYVKTGDIKPKQSKYHNKKTEYNGDIYDSRREATRAAELDLMVKAGELAAVCRQVPFMLAGGVKYIADFVLIHNDGTWTVEDSKGMKTDVYKIKAKLFKERYGQKIKEV